MANSAGMPGDRFGTRRPSPRTRNICGATKAASLASGDRVADQGHSTK
jgi:hypothetical protein